MNDLIHSDLFKFLAVVIPLAVIGSRVSAWFYLRTLRKLRERHGGTVRDRWITYPELVLPQPEGEIIVSSSPGGSYASETSAQTYFDSPIGCRFHIESRGMPHPSIERAREDWLFKDWHEFPLRFKAYGDQPKSFDDIFSRELVDRIENFIKSRPVRIRLDEAQEYKDGRLRSNRLPRLAVATSPSTSDLEATNELLELCISIRNKIRESGAGRTDTDKTPEPEARLKKMFR